MNNLLASSAKALSNISRLFNLGHGSTWPGHIALQVNPHIVQDLLRNAPTHIILIVGTNGKTTTATMLTTILEYAGKTVIQNTSGANLLNGIASSLLLNTNIQGKLTADYAVLEVDENNLPIVLSHLTPKAIIALDLFRDQLDRYGELDSITKKWNFSFQKLTPATTLILNADDPLIANIGICLSSLSSLGEGQGEVDSKKRSILYFGLSDKEKGQKRLEHDSDSTYCPNCGHKLQYTKIFYSHLGLWHCLHCGVKRPLPQTTDILSPLPGTYNIYNTQAAVLAASVAGVEKACIAGALQKVTPAFGRQEKIIYKGKQVQIFLSKNPVSMNESLRIISDSSAKHVLFVINDRIPDGRDVSWIWDIAMEEYADKFENIFISGDRCYDMGLRVSYSMEFPISNFQFPNNKQNPNIQIFDNLKDAIDTVIEQLPENETFYILPTYSAMLKVRKILTGKKIL